MTGKHPPAHFSGQDPWRAYRLALLLAPESSHQQFSAPKGQDSLSTPIAPASWPNVPLCVWKPSQPWRSVLLAAPPFPTPKAPAVFKQSSKFCGIIWDVASQSWRAKIKVKGKTWYLGIYKDEDAAARAYDAARWFVYGPKGSLNFIDINYDLLGPPRTPPSWLVHHLIQLVGWCSVLAASNSPVLERRFKKMAGLRARRSEPG
jgi:hypothetical protein